MDLVASGLVSDVEQPGMGDVPALVEENEMSATDRELKPVADCTQSHLVLSTERPSASAGTQVLAK